ncbi:DMT family transporter [Candidatus Cloacimonadota bacterium]
MKESIISENKYSRLITIVQALLVTFLWSTSFILIKKGLVEIPPVTYAGLRYGLAFLIFFPMILQKKYLVEIKNLSTSKWFKLILLGIVFYSFTQGAQFLGLSLLPSVTVSLMLNFTPLIVAFLGVLLLNEKPSLLQWSGSGLFIIGILIYFIPVDLSGSRGIGLIIMFLGVITNSLATIIGRDINRKKNISPIIVTFISMGIGAFVLITIGLVKNGIPIISFRNWCFLIWLAAINTAFAFTLWNLTMRSLRAMESSIINGTMLIQIAILAWIFLGEKITWQEGSGMVIAALGAVMVQMRKKAGGRCRNGAKEDEK